MKPIAVFAAIALSFSGALSESVSHSDPDGLEASLSNTAFPRLTPVKPTGTHPSFSPLKNDNNNALTNDDSNAEPRFDGFFNDAEKSHENDGFWSAEAGTFGEEKGGGMENDDEGYSLLLSSGVPLEGYAPEDTKRQGQRYGEKRARRRGDSLSFLQFSKGKSGVSPPSKSGNIGKEGSQPPPSQSEKSAKEGSSPPDVPVDGFEGAAPPAVPEVPDEGASPPQLPESPSQGISPPTIATTGYDGVS